nr:unnamed protein product [Callosobruchus analis]
MTLSTIYVQSVVTRRKYHVGRLLNREVWVLGIYDTTLKRGHIMYVPDRSRQTLEGKIQRFVRPGSEIWTNCWSGYTGLSALGYVHRTVNHSNNFVDPLSGVCTNQVEGYWYRLKQFLRRLGALQSSFLPEYIDQFMWWQIYGPTPAARFNNLLDQIAAKHAF